MIENFDLFKELAGTSGISGFEDDVSDIFSRELENNFGTKPIKDTYDNLFTEEKSINKGPTILISCHLDEVGLIVKKIDRDNGKIYFEKVGSINNENLIGQKVSIASPVGLLSGIIDNDGQQNFIGLKKSSDIDQITIGYPISFLTKITKHGKNRISGKSFDNRVGCFAILEMIKQLDLDEIKGTLQIAGFSKAELGLGGIMPFTHPPDFILYIDTVESGDVPNSDSDIRVGEGVVFPISYQNDGTLAICPKNLIMMEKIAEKREISHQVGSVYAEACLKNTIRNLYNLCPNILPILIPTRYHHSAIEMIDFNDLNDCIKLLGAYSIQSVKQ